MILQLDEYLKTIGYQVIPSNLPEFIIYYHLENNGVNIIHLVDCHDTFSITNEQFEHVKDTIIKLFGNKGIENVHILSLLVSTDVDRDKRLAMQDSFCWIINKKERKLIVYENQVPDYYGLRQSLEGWLNTPDVLRQKKTEKTKKQDLGQFPWVAAGLCAANIIIFILGVLTGGLLYNGGMLIGWKVLGQKEIYRMFTSMFLHADISHLFNNMILLYFVGELVERELGHFRMTVLYFVSGLAGGVLSILYDFYTNEFVGSIGASGAVFGLVGGLLFLVILHKGKLQSVTIGRMVFMIAYSLYSGFVGTNIDNAAHIGGLIGGFLLSIILYAVGPKEKKIKGDSQ